MPPAARQVKRNREIVAARAAGETVEALAERFNLSQTRIKQVLREEPDAAPEPGGAVALALERRREYCELVAELRVLARRLHAGQAAAKVGAYRTLLDALDRLTTLERLLGFLPDDLGRVRSERSLVEAVFAVFVEHDVPAEARRALVARLDSDEAAA